VPVDVALYPSSTVFAAGESLELIISSDEIIPSPPYRKDVSINRGIHVIHCGGDYDSHLLVPVIPALSSTDGPWKENLETRSIRGNANDASDLPGTPTRGRAAKCW
jgi:hypothetical protein